MADDFTIDEGKGIPAGSGDDFDPSEMSLDEIDSLLSSEDDSSDFSFDSLPVDSRDSGGFEELLASSGDEYPDDLANFEPDETELGSDLSQLDETVHLDEDFDFDLTDPLIDAEIDRLLDIEDDFASEAGPAAASSAPSWKESATPAASSTHDDGFGDLGGLDLGDFSQPGDIPASAFHSEEKPFESFHDSSQGLDSHDSDEAMGFGDLDDDEAPISLSDDELHNIDISADLADFSMDDEVETQAPDSSRGHEDDFLADDEGPISLSEHELGDIMEDDFAPNNEEEGFGDLGGDDFTLPSSELTEDVNFEGEDEEKDIALSVDELDHLLSGDETTTSAEDDTDSFSDLENFGDLDLGAATENDLSVSSSNFSHNDEEDDSNEPIALSDDELSNLLADGDDETAEPIDLRDLNIESGPETTPKDMFALEEEEDSISLPISDFENFAGADGSNPLDTGIDLGDFDEPADSKSEDSLQFSDDFTSARDEDILGASNAEDDIFTVPVNSTSSDDFLADVADDEPIALSDDELGNLLSSGTEEEAEDSVQGLSDFQPADSDFLSDVDENEPIALSDDELGNLLSSEGDDTSEFTSTLDGDDEGPIALSDEELGDLLSSGTEEEPGTIEAGDDLVSNEPPTEFGDFSIDSEADEPIALSEDELGNLLAGGEEEMAAEFADESEEPISLPISELDDIASGIDPEKYEVDWDGPVADLNDLGAPKTTAPSDWDLGEEADEPIALSDEELGNLLSDETPHEIESEDLDALLSSPPAESDLDALGSMGDDIPIADLDFTENFGGEIIPTVESLAPEPELNFILDEYADENELSPLEEVRQAGAIDETDSKEESNPTQEETKRILLYLDELLGNLPEDMIRDFSRSDYFELYKKLMKQIGV